MSIERYGLLHPIVLDADGRLVAGARRLRACEQLGWTDVPVRWLGELSEQELCEIELEENLRRKDLTAFERSKIMAERAAVAEQVLVQQRLEDADFSSESDDKSRMGQPRKATSQAAVADYVGVSQSTVSEARAHVAAVDAYPELEPLPQKPALEIAATLDKLPDERRQAARAIVREQARAEQIESDRLLEAVGRDDRACAPGPGHQAPPAQPHVPVDSRSSILQHRHWPGG